MFAYPNSAIGFIQNCGRNAYIYIYMSIVTMWRSECTSATDLPCVHRSQENVFGITAIDILVLYSFVLVLTCIFFVRRPIDNKVTASCKFYFVVYGDSELLFKISKIPLHITYFLTLM
jgi:hypothetical protein